MKDNIKIALLALIAVTLIIDTFMEGDKGGRSAATELSSNQVITPNNPTNPSTPEGIQSNEPIANNLPKTSVQFAEMEYDFGEIFQDSKNEHIFTFTNTGEEPLVISDAKGSCGCTVPDYPRHPIAPGETGEIKVVYSPGKQAAQQTKTVTINANTAPETTVLKIFANVQVPEGGSDQPAQFDAISTQ